MPKNAVIELAHGAYTDHAIPRHATAIQSRRPAPHDVLAAFGNAAASDRDLGLAYALVVESGRNPLYEERAFGLLKRAVAQRPNDVPALVQLAQLYGYRGDEEHAMELYQKVVRADASQVVAANNLATYLIRGGRSEEAIRLWSDLLKRSPGFEAARINLAVAQFRAGKLPSAEESLLKGLDLNPAQREMRTLLSEIHRSKAR
jgi:tetratricopeptide (TPR) repeat protein